MLFLASGPAKGDGLTKGYRAVAARCITHWRPDATSALPACHVCPQHERWLQCGLDADMVILDDGQAVEQVSKIKGTATTLRWWRWVNTAWQAYKSRLVRAHLWSLLQPSSSVEVRPIPRTWTLSRQRARAYAAMRIRPQLK